MERKVRVRFAPSPTGGLHLGGVRTVLFNYLFARQHNGDFVLRIEDTDQTRFVEGAEQYINDCLAWCGMKPDEGPNAGGQYGPYRQSERKPMYRQYAEQLVQQGNAYYAFDTPEELEAMRTNLKSESNPSPQYDHKTRMQMRNSISLPADEVQKLLDAGTPYVIRIHMPENETLEFHDLIRGDVSFHTELVDDKVLLKRDGMPTYHLAVVVDDYLMQISHAFRGEEWLPSAPVHLLLWKYLGWENAMPQWAHLPLILKPDGHGKLSKRDGDRLGFPVFAMNWGTPGTESFTEGFRERGFLPEAFVNMLAVLGWNDGTEQEIFSMEELIQRFSIDRVHKGGAKFDFEKAKWFNHEYIKHAANEKLAPLVTPYFAAHGVTPDAAQLEQVIGMIKERCTVLGDFWQQGSFFFTRPATHNIDAVKPKWTPEKTAFFEAFSTQLGNLEWTTAALEQGFKDLATEKGIKPGELQLPLRIMLVGDKFGPNVFEIAAFLGKEETGARIAALLQQL